MVSETHLNIKIFVARPLLPPTLSSGKCSVLFVQFFKSIFFFILMKKKLNGKRARMFECFISSSFICCYFSCFFSAAVWNFCLCITEMKSKQKVSVYFFLPLPPFCSFRTCTCLVRCLMDGVWTSCIKAISYLFARNGNRQKGFTFTHTAECVQQRKQKKR